jgi:beta-phosphoglucomutase-like phosphatase (HAD superfamily)
MDITQYVLLAAVIAGVTEFLNRLRAKDYWVATTVATSAVIGGLFGAFGVEGLTLVSGIAAGFGVSGSFSAIGMVRGKSAPAPSDPIVKA